MEPAKQPLNIHLYLTPNCNLACTHCYYDAWSLRETPTRLLTVDEVHHVITTLCDEYDADFHVEGGEAFLRPDLPEMFDRIPERYWRSVTLTTSGTVPIQVAPDHLRKVGNLRISVEGHTDKLQRQIRGVPLKPVLETCRRLSEQMVPFEIRITLFRNNVGQFRQMLETFADLGAQSFGFYEYQAVGRGAQDDQKYRLDGDDIEGVLDQLLPDMLPGIRHLKLSLPPRRSAQVLRRRAELEASGCDVVEVGTTPSLTINYDGGIGISPWKITANRIEDQFATLDATHLGSEIRRRIEDGTLNRLCDSCSELLVLKRVPSEAS